MSPMFAGGKLMGFRRKYNDKLLMFCLRHYGQDANGRRTTINYFSTRASAGAADGAAGAEASTTTVRTVITEPSAESGGAANDDERGARGDEAAAILNGFDGVVLDAEAAAAIAAALDACAARARAVQAAYDRGGNSAVEAAAEDPDAPFVRADPFQAISIGAIESPAATEEWVPFVEGEVPWELAGLEMSPERAALEERLSSGSGSPPGEEPRADE